MGGRIANPGAFDYSIVHMKFRGANNKTYGCTGTMISERHLLTCLHCLKNQTFFTHFTFDTIIHEDTVFNITDFNIHIYDDRVDLAIIEFTKNTKFKHKNMHKMHLVADDMLDPHIQEKIHKKGYIAGYGSFKFENYKKLSAEFAISDGRLRIARVPIYPKEYCGDGIRICSSDWMPPFVYHGDSGGPLFFFHNEMSNKTKESEREELDFNITHPKRHHKMYQFGLIASGEIGRSYSLPIHQYCWWIEKVTNWEVQCEYIFENRGISVSPPPHEAAEKIMEGQIVDPDVFDYSIVHMKFRGADNKTYGCTGTMISERHLLTCRHCVEDIMTEEPHTHFTFNIFEEDAPFDIVDIHIFFGQNVDAAIIEFAKNTKFKYKNMHKMTLLGENMSDKYLQDKIHNKGYVAGYGSFMYETDEDTGAEVSRSDGQLRIAKVPINSSTECGRLEEICSSGGQLGDSGGPLFFFHDQMSNKTNESEQEEFDFNITHPKRHHKMYQFGLIFDGKGKRTLSLPMTKLCDWIEGVTRMEAQCELFFTHRRRRSISPPPRSVMDLKNGSPNFQPFENDENIQDSDISSKSDNSNVLPLSDLPKTEFEDEENEMDAEDLSCILNCINILILICLIILLCYYFCFKTSESNVQLPTVIQKV
uniref:Peptidase S1 domain-containing protein n=1 Tax=Panagrolaimus davidi TaxID=227884 RepID=A0A914R9Y2_9BILA